MRWIVALALAACASSAEAAPRLLDCARSSEPDICRQAQSQYREERANPNDYTSMRNVAYCLWTGCDGAFAIDRAGSCKIRRSIMDRHRNVRDGNDDMHFANCVRAGH